MALEDSAAGGTLLGTNSLQQGIDKFSSAVNKLDNVVNQLGTLAQSLQRPNAGGGRPSASGATGNTGSTQQQQNNIGTAYFPKMYNPFRNNPILNYAAPNASGYSVAPQQQTYQQAQQAWSQQTGRIPASQTYTPFSAPKPQASSGNGGWGVAAGAGVAAGFIGGMVASRGTSQLGAQATMNQLAWQANMAASNGPPGATNSYTRALYYNAYGANNQNLNYMAWGAQDATQGMANVMTASGSATPWQTPLGRTIMGGQASLAFASPGMTSAQTSQVAGQLYSPQTSMRMMQMGYRAQPLRMGGGQNSMGQVMQSFMQRNFGQSSVSPQRLQSAMARNLGTSIQALGLTPQAQQSFAQSLTTYNKLASQGVSYGQAQQWMTEAEHGGPGFKSAIADLGAKGITMSDVQRLKNAGATKTGQLADQSSAYNSALQKSVSLLNSFNAVLNNILNATGMNKVAGAIKGGTAGASSSGGIGGMVKGALNIATFGIAGMVGGAAPVAGGHGGQQGAAKSSTTGGTISGSARTAVEAAEKELGVPYQWGGETPGVGFDCSGLVQWAYGRAGVKLPRTSEQQWAFLRNRAVNVKDVQEGDLVFMGGSDGTANDPGHVGMMVSRNKLIQAPHTGADVQIIGYNPREWSHAARPAGSMKGSSSANGAGSLAGQQSNVMTAGQGNSGASMGGLGGYAGDYGSTNELAALQGAAGGGTTGSGMPTLTLSNSSTGAGTKTNSKSTAAINGGGSISANKNLMQRLAAAFGWGSGQEWSALNSLVMSESGYNNKIWNGTGSGAYGIAQSLPASKYPVAGRPPSMGGRSDPKSQEVWMLDYIKGRYGDPVHAWAFHQAHNSYAGGTLSSQGGLALTGERGREMLKLPKGTQVFDNAQTEKIMKAAEVKPVSPSSLFTDVPGTQQSSGQHTISINFAANSIVIQGGNLSNTQGLVQSLGQEIGDKVVQSMKKQQTIDSIASGVK